MLGKKFRVYDSQISCQQGGAFVRNLATPPRRGDSSIKKVEFLSQANLDVSRSIFVPLSWSAPRSDFTLINVNSLSDEFFVRFLLIQRQTREYCEGLNFDEIYKSSSVI